VPAKNVKSAKKAKPGQPKPGQVFGRAGLSYTFPEGEGGPIRIMVDFGSAPEPLQYYYADSIHVVVDEELRMAILSLGRRDANTNKFVDRIEMVMPAKALFGQFWLSSREVESAVDKILESSGVAAKPRLISPPETPAGGTFFANMIFIGVGEGESVLDFYQLSPRAVHFAKLQRQDMQLQPTIRVFISTVLTKCFFNVLRPHVGEQGSNVQQVGSGDKRAVRSR